MSANDGLMDVQDLALDYDELGNVRSRTDTAWGEPGYAQKNLTESFDYDDLGRPTKVTHTDDSYETTTYDGFKTTYTNTLNQVKSEIRNVLGELTLVQESLGSTTPFIEYTYDATGNLRKTKVGDTYPTPVSDRNATHPLQRITIARRAASAGARASECNYLTIYDLPKDIAKITYKSMQYGGFRVC